MSSAGLHLIMDAHVADPSVFTRERLEKLFAQLTSALEMKALDKAAIYEVPVDPEVLERVKRTGQFEDEGGITGFQVISTSHMALHAWPLQSFFSLDAFSCKEFNHELAQTLIEEALGVIEANVLVLSRRKPDGTGRTYLMEM